MQWWQGGHLNTSCKLLAIPLLAKLLSNSLNLSIHLLVVRGVLFSGLSCSCVLPTMSLSKVCNKALSVLPRFLCLFFLFCSSSWPFVLSCSQDQVLAWSFCSCLILARSTLECCSPLWDKLFTPLVLAFISFVF